VHVVGTEKANTAERIFMGIFLVSSWKVDNKV
jgi:hypothetical protein